jgi:pyruvate kinase
MARYVSNLRPGHASIFAFTPNEMVCRQLSVCWGVFPLLLQFTHDPNATIEAATQSLRDRNLIVPDDNLVILSDVRAGEQLVDCVQLRHVH